MTPERHWELEKDFDLKLTPDEVAAGWHFCPDWDYMLIHDSHIEINGCACQRLNTSLTVIHANTSR